MTQPPLSVIHWSHQRRHELDWLRVLAFGLLIFYHLGMAYVAEWGWHVKSTYQSSALQYLMLWSNQWRMSLLFLISGAAVSYQFHRYSGWRTLSANSRKLLLPLIFGSFVIVAPQAFVESKTAGAIPDLSYLEFWRHYVMYPWGFGDSLPPVYGRFGGANVTWNHLWYLAYLFVYILVLWILYPLLCHRVTIRITSAISRLSLVFLYLIPIGLVFGIGEWLWKRFPTTHLLVDDWHNHARYFTVFLLGFGLVRSHRLWQGLMHMRKLSLALALITYSCICIYLNEEKFLEYASWLAAADPLRGLIWSANLWLWIMAVIGYAQAWLNQPSGMIAAANRAVYCWYILHQTLIVMAVYWLRDKNLGPLFEPIAVGTLTIVGCGVGYLFLREIPVLSLLCGISMGPWSHSIKRLMQGCLK